MGDEIKGYRTTSARRSRRGPTVLAGAAFALLLLVAVLALRDRQRDNPVVASAVSPTSRRLPSSTASPSPTATKTVLVEARSGWVEVAVPTATPSPWPTPAPAATPTRRRGPSPTPRPAECVDHRWTASQVFTPSAQVLVEITAVNRCGRDLGPVELWFEISGWRDGGLVQSVRGHPFERVRSGGSAIVAIGLPGSIDWYDQVRVEIVD